MTKTAKIDSPQNQKSDKNVSCWMTEHEFNALGEECEEAVRGVPGARLSRSSFLVELFRQHLRSKKIKQAGDQ